MIDDGRMNIYAKSGDKVIFSFPGSGYEYHQETAKEHLVLNETYTVDYTEVHSWFTEVYLKEVPGVAFNSVLFASDEKNIEKGSEMAVYRVNMRVSYQAGHPGMNDYEKEVLCKAKTPMEAITKAFTQYCGFEKGYKDAEAKAELLGEEFLE